MIKTRVASISVKSQIPEQGGRRRTEASINQSAITRSDFGRVTKSVCWKENMCHDCVWLKQTAPGRWRWGTSSCLRTSGVPACPGLCSGTGWRSRTAGWRPGGPATGSAPWCSVWAHLHLVSVSLRLGLPLPCVSAPAPGRFWFLLPARLLLLLRCQLLPCYDDDTKEGAEPVQ